MGRLIKLLVASVLVAGAVSVAGPAHAAELEYTFVGSGWGHGIGMSQYGAKGAAQAGMSYDRILTHFYTGTTVAPRTMPPKVQIGLQQGVSSVAVSSGGTFDFRLNGEQFLTASGGGSWTVTPTATGAFRVRGPSGQDQTAGDPTKRLEVHYEGHGSILTTDGHQHRYGYLELNTTTSGSSYVLRSILHILMDHYLLGLGEMPSSWHMEALKAQAVAGRTYALDKVERVGIRSSCNCHLLDDTRDQAYIGYAKETSSGGDRWRSAVGSTGGRVVLHDGRPIQAFYSSSSGGHTEHNENVWGGSPVAYLRGVDDPWDRQESPFINWEVHFTKAQLESKLNGQSSTTVGDLRSLTILPPLGVSGRVTRVVADDRGGVRIEGGSGTKRVSGDTLRSVLGLRSTLFTFNVSLAHPDGSLVQGSGPQVWLVSGGSLVHLPSPTVLRSSYTTADVLRVPEGMVNRFSRGKQLFREGSLVQTPDGRVWAISDGLKRHVVSPTVFSGLGYSWSAVRRVSPEEAALHQTGEPISSASAHPDGTLISGSDGRVYFLENGKRRHVVSQAAFESRFDGAEVSRTTDAKVLSYPSGSPLGFRDGTLIQTPDGRVWAITDGVRRHVANPSVFGGLRYSSSNVRRVGQGEADIHPTGDQLRVAAHPNGTLLQGSRPEVWVVRGGTRLHVFSANVLVSQYDPSEIVRVSDDVIASIPAEKNVFREGSLIRTPEGRVWIVSDGLRRHIASPSVFEGLGYSWSAVRSVSSGEAALHRIGEAVPSASVHPNGSLIRGPDGRVYFVEHGVRRYVVSPGAFESRFQWVEVAGVSEAAVGRYAQGRTLGYRDGSLIQTPDGRVWTISGGLRRHILNPQAFGALRYSTGNVRRVSDGEASVHEVGDPVG